MSAAKGVVPALPRHLCLPEPRGRHAAAVEPHLPRGAAPAADGGRVPAVDASEQGAALHHLPPAAGCARPPRHRTAWDQPPRKPSLAGARRGPKRGCEVRDAARLGVRVLNEAGDALRAGPDLIRRARGMAARRWLTSCGRAAPRPRSCCGQRRPRPPCRRGSGPRWRSSRNSGS